MIAATTAANLKFAVYLGVALLVGLVLHEYGHAWMADRLGDQTPRRFGRLTLNPRPLVDPLGTIILPVFLLLLAAAGGAAVPFAYAKPMPLNPMALRRPNSDMVRITLAGPAANLIVAAAAGIGLRLLGSPNPSSDVFQFLFAFLLANLFMGVFQLMPIPGLDGAKLLARYLHGRAKEVYESMDQYLPLFMLLVFFIILAPVVGFVNIFTRALCKAFAGSACPFV